MNDSWLSTEEIISDVFEPLEQAKKTKTKK